MKRLWHRLFGHSPVYSWTIAADNYRWNGWWTVGCSGCGRENIRRDYRLTS